MNDNKSLQNKNKPSSNIELRSFLIVVIMLCSLLIVSGMLSYVIPQGSFAADENGVITFTPKILSSWTPFF